MRAVICISSLHSPFFFSLKLELRHVLLLLYTLIGLQDLTFPKVLLFLALTGATDYSRKPAAGTRLRLTKRIIDLLKDKRVPDKEGSTVSSVLAAITPALAAIDEEVRAAYMALEPTNGNNRGEAMRRTAHALNGQASMLGAALDYINGELKYIYNLYFYFYLLLLDGWLPRALLVPFRTDYRYLCIPPTCRRL